MQKDDFIGPVNVGNTHEITILELAEKIIKLCDSKSELVFEELPEDDPMQRKPDITLAKKVLDWEPTVEIDDGLKKTIEYFETVL
jgi:UDP-glucuronate decarboxylase